MRTDHCLPEQGPAIVPLHGKGGSPVRFGDRKVSTTAQPYPSVHSQRLNLHKETLHLDQKTIVPAPQT